MDKLFAKVRAMDVDRLCEDRPMEGDIFRALFLKRNSLVIKEIFPHLRERLTCHEFQAKFLAQFRKSAKVELNQLDTNARELEVVDKDACFYTRQIPLLKEKLAIDSLDGYLRFLSNSVEKFPEIVEKLAHQYSLLHLGKDGTEYVKEHYPLYQIGSFLYQRYVAKVSCFESFERPIAKQLIDLYKEKLNINLKNADLQFNKYDLLSKSEHFSIHNDKDSQTVVDERIERFFWIKVPRELLAAIEYSINNNWVNDIAFEIGLITDLLPAFEDLERGSIFSFEALKLPPVSKLYDKECYDNALWIKVDKYPDNTHPNSITFEELCADFPDLDGHVVTQVVHLEFFVDKGQYFVSHLDHEYILYTEGAYNGRRGNKDIKGDKKRKTFKVDNARIPFDFKFKDRYFFFLLLDSYFNNKGLIHEYFEGISQH